MNQSVVPTTAQTSSTATTTTSSTTTATVTTTSTNASEAASNNNNPSEVTNNTEEANTSAAKESDDIDLISHEQLPDQWPEEFPGIIKYAPEEPPNYQLQFDSNDIALLNNLSNLAPGALIDEIKAMRGIACMLSIEEEKEKARGRILSVLLG